MKTDEPERIGDENRGKTPCGECGTVYEFCCAYSRRKWTRRFGQAVAEAAEKARAEEREAWLAVLPKCRDCGKPATRCIDGKWFCDEWGEPDDDWPWAALVRACVKATPAA